MSRTDSFRVLFRLLAAALPLVACNGHSPTIGTVEQRLPGATLLNEVVADPPGSDGPWEFVELVGPPGNALEGYNLLFVDGDAESNQGSVDRIVDLGSACDGGCRLDSDGIALLAPTGGHSALDTGATILSGLPSGALENGSLSLVLAECDEPLRTGDIDPNNTGQLELPSGCTLVDAVAWTDGDEGDSTYGPRISDRAPGAATRVGTVQRALDATAWFSGELVGDPDTLVYAEASCPTLTPGAPNTSCAPDSGTVSADAGGAPTPASPAGTSAEHDARDDPVSGTATAAGGRSGWETSLVRGGASPRGGSAGTADALPMPPRTHAPSTCRMVAPTPASFLDGLAPFWPALLLLGRTWPRRRTRLCPASPQS